MRAKSAGGAVKRIDPEVHSIQTADRSILSRSSLSLDRPQIVNQALDPSVHLTPGLSLISCIQRLHGKELAPHGHIAGAVSLDQNRAVDCVENVLLRKASPIVHGKESQIWGFDVEDARHRAVALAVNPVARRTMNQVVCPSAQYQSSRRNRGFWFERSRNGWINHGQRERDNLKQEST